MKPIDDILNSQKKKVLLAIYPHPDDETMAAGGLLMRAKRLGFRTVAVILTQGGAGQLHIHPKGRTIKQIRKQELIKAAKILGIDELVVGDFDDGKLVSEKSAWTPWVQEQITKFDPGIVVTYDQTGISGHPDHISLSLEISKLKGNFVLLWTSMIDKLKSTVVHKDVIDLVAVPTHVLDLGFDFVSKWLAARAHESQSLGKDLPVPLLVALGIYHYEWYHEVDRSHKYPYKFVEFKI